MFSAHRFVALRAPISAWFLMASGFELAARLFWYLLLGLPGAAAYRAINTLDAMLGYRGELEYLGKASARLDDLVNLIPARLTALLLWLVSAVAWRKSKASELGYPGAVGAELPPALRFD